MQYSILQYIYSIYAYRPLLLCYYFATLYICTLLLKFFINVTNFFDTALNFLFQNINGCTLVDINLRF